MAIAAAFLYWNIVSFSKSPRDFSNDTERILVIPKGFSFDATIRMLYENDLIANVFKMKILSALKGGVSIKAGEYLLSASMTPVRILNILERGEVHLYRCTIPEGFNINQIAEVFEIEGFCSKEKFIEKVTDRNFMRSFNINQNSLEGYLFPDTYFFPKGIFCNDLIYMMIKRFFNVFSNVWRRRTEDLGFTVHQILTIASMIEKETRISEERSLISSVFHNRLKIGMKLQCDPTVIYGIKNFDGNIKKEDLMKSTPYNTYIIKELPPGPIANPGKESIHAALFPADTDFYFFVAKKDGTHKFSKTFKEHNLAVKRFQL